MPVLSHEQSPASATTATQLGNAISVMLGVRQYLDFRLAALTAWLVPPVKLNQFKIYFDEKGRPVGYVTWAFLSEETQRRWTTDPETVLHASEWNEGLNLWIIDFVAPFGFVRPMVADLRDNIFADHDTAHWLRSDKSDAAPRARSWQRSNLLPET